MIRLFYHLYLVLLQSCKTDLCSDNFSLYNVMHLINIWSTWGKEKGHWSHKPLKGRPWCQECRFYQEAEILGRIGYIIGRVQCKILNVEALLQKTWKISVKGTKIWNILPVIGKVFLKWLWYVLFILHCFFKERKIFNYYHELHYICCGMPVLNTEHQNI